MNRGAGTTTGASRLPIPALDSRLGLCPLFVTVPREKAVELKVLLESYECFGVARTEDAEFRPGRTLVALLLVSDFVADAMAMLESVAGELGLEPVEPAPELLARLRGELGCS